MNRTQGRIISLARNGTGVIADDSGILYIIRPDSISRRTHNRGRIYPNVRVTFEVRHLLDGRIAMNVQPWIQH
jgi:hypothetical protein